MLKVLNSLERIPDVIRLGDHLYNFWQDDKHVRGVWRRTTLAQYREAQPSWETLLDLDALSEAEGENWVWAGADCVGPDYRRCLISLSRGGSDAEVKREFDVTACRFVEDGFVLSDEARSNTTWLDEDTLLVSTDFGADSMTHSGYPRIIKRWTRGQPLSDAPTVFAGHVEDKSVFALVDDTPGFERVVIGRMLDYYNAEQFLLHGDHRLVKIDVPSDAMPIFWRAQLLLRLRSDARVGEAVYPGGSLLAIRADDFLKGDRNWQLLFTPTATRSLVQYLCTREAVLLSILDNVAGRLQEMRPADGQWTVREVQTPFPGTLNVQSLDDQHVANDSLGNNYLLTYTDFLQPPTLALALVGSDIREPLKAQPAFFDARGMRVEQCFATSKDGTRVPYFVVWPEGAKLDGDNPTLLDGYGGFANSQRPAYSGVYGEAWHARGGVRVVANIRGGGEYGPAWHQAAVKEHKHRSFEDFIAVAEDLVARGITRPERLAIQGGSNGGLLVGSVMVQRPELFGAVLCNVPLLDMQRYSDWLVGASWIAEYGDPHNPADWKYISKYSPYQNVKAGVNMPPVLFITSTRDDRVHPAHARKMAARMMEQGHQVWYYENTEGGHGGAADNEQMATVLALQFEFLWATVGSVRATRRPVS